MTGQAASDDNDFISCQVADQSRVLVIAVLTSSALRVGSSSDTYPEKSFDL